MGDGFLVIDSSITLCYDVSIFDYRLRKALVMSAHPITTLQTFTVENDSFLSRLFNPPPRCTALEVLFSKVGAKRHEVWGSRTRIDDQMRTYANDFLFSCLDEIRTLVHALQAAGKYDSAVFSDYAGNGALVEIVAIRGQYTCFFINRQRTYDYQQAVEFLAKTGKQNRSYLIGQ